MICQYWKLKFTYIQYIGGVYNPQHKQLWDSFLGGEGQKAKFVNIKDGGRQPVERPGMSIWT